MTHHGNDPRPGRRTVLGALALAALAWPTGLRASAAPRPALVMVLPVMHHFHAGNPRYSYRDVYALVRAFHPDVVGVEIRQEDLHRPAGYLRDNYPREMIHLARLYGRRAFGFDWLGDELSGRPVPHDWWKRQSRIKALEREMDAAPSGHTARARRLATLVDALQSRQMRIVATATAASLAGGDYDRVTRSYYRTLGRLTQGTRFSELPRWYARRDREIAANIVRAARSRPGQRIVVVTGADHHGPVVAALSRIGPQVVVVPVP